MVLMEDGAAANDRARTATGREAEQDDREHCVLDGSDVGLPAIVSSALRTIALELTTRAVCYLRY